jgi:hypothetical protein
MRCSGENHYASQAALQASIEPLWRIKPKCPDDDPACTGRADEGFQCVTQGQGMQEDRHCR